MKKRRPPKRLASTPQTSTFIENEMLPIKMGPLIAFGEPPPPSHWAYSPPLHECNFWPELVDMSDITAQHQNKLVVFTDASATDSGACSSAFHVWIPEGPPTHGHSELAKTCGNANEAKLHAIKLALEHANGRPLSIFTDSMGAIAALRVPRPRSQTNRDVYDMLLSNPNTTVCFVRSHSGISGNEHADKQAKSALRAALN